MKIDKFFELKSIGRGKLTIGIVACIHGNEKVGKLLHDWLIQQQWNLKVELRLVFGNPKAYQKKIRFIHSNLNRVFPGNTDGNYEEQQAVRILNDLKGVDILIDIHSTTEDVQPFVFCSENNFSNSLVKATGLKRIICFPYTQGTSFEGNTLIQAMGCPSIIVECGQHAKDSTLHNAIFVLKNILMCYGLLTGEAEIIEQQYFSTIGVLKAQHQHMHIDKSIKEFVRVKKNSVVATGKHHKLLAPCDFYPSLIDRQAKIREDMELLLMLKKTNNLCG